MPARCSRIHSSAKILSMKRSSRVPLVSQCTTSLSECAVAGSMFGGAFILLLLRVTWIGGTGYVVFPLDGVNGVRRNLLARIGLLVGCRVQTGVSAPEPPRTLVFSLEVSGFSQCFQKPFRHFVAFWAIEITTEFLFVGMAVASPCASFSPHDRPFTGAPRRERVWFLFSVQE